VTPYLTRNYPLGADFAHVVGYVGRIDDKDAARLDADRYAGTTHIGKSGIERFYEARLHGTPGYELVEVNVDQRPQRVLERVAPTPGENLYLTIDTKLQKATIAAFDGRPGAAVAIDPRNGEVLAMVTVPSFDPNLFVNGISRDDYSTLLENPDKPLLDRALRGGYPPGSTIKPFMGLAGLELGIRKPQDTVLSTGEFHIPGQARGYRDDVRGGSGVVNLVQAITQSVNTYFYSLALQMGIDRMDAFLSKFGFGSETGIDLPAESDGVLPSPEWKRKTFNTPWYVGETVIAGIGQGYWVVTPLQLAHAVAVLAEAGLPHAPHLLRATRAALNAPVVTVNYPDPPASLIHNPANFEAVRAGMIGAVNDPRGTAYKLGEGFPFVIAGKTGTAERFSRTSEAWTTTKNKVILAARHRALFECFTPAEAPRIAVVVVLEAGAWGGSDAAPIARKMLNAWLTEQPDAPRPSSIVTAAAATTDTRTEATQ
ncbi:MAG: penicillin-binding protein 2, partial [Pseudomonadota bacterium]|nr:penicillin-binding protein 2 [Pseudomonadota bacterium]